MTDDLDYIKAEAERLSNDTAARFLAALDAMDRVGETRWIDDPKLPSQILSTPIVSTPATDYIRTEAERLLNDTAARFIEALDAMDGATEPMESDSDMNVKSLDSDKNVTSGLHARSKRLERSTPDALVQRNGKQSHVVPTFVTITISREAARFVQDLCATLPIQEGSAVKVVAAIDAALEGER